MTSTYVSYLQAERNYVRTVTSAIRSGPVAREVEYFVQNIGSVSTGDELVDDPRLYRFALTAFGLESQIFAKGLIRKLFNEGVTDERALANRLTDSKFKTMAKAFAFAEVGDYNVNNPEFVSAVVERYLNVQVEKQAGEQNVGVRLALYFDRMAGSVSNWYAVLADPALREVVRVGLNLPSEINVVGPDRLVQILEDRYDIEDFKDPARRQKFLQRFTLLYDIENGPPGPSLERAALFAPLRANASGGQIITIDPATLRASRSY